MSATNTDRAIIKGLKSVLDEVGSIIAETIVGLEPIDPEEKETFRRLKRIQPKWNFWWKRAKERVEVKPKRAKAGGFSRKEAGIIAYLVDSKLSDGGLDPDDERCLLKIINKCERIMA